MPNVNYNVGRGAVSQLYTNLMDALKNKGDAENRRKAEDIERQGFFGTGIKSSDIRDLSNTGMAFAEFGEGRKERKISRATESFKRRMGQAQDRIDELRRFGDDDSINEIRAIQAGMAEERTSFENLLSDYEDTSLLDSGLGGKGVGYKDTGEASAFTKAMMEAKSNRDEARIRQEMQAKEDEHRMQQGQGFRYHEPTGKFISEPRKGQMGERSFMSSDSLDQRGGMAQYSPSGFLEEILINRGQNIR